jgi:uncharacterized protein (DUF362 family)
MSNFPQRKFKVGVIKVKESQYPKEAPYHPSINYPEYPFSPHISSEANHVYDGIRQLFLRLELDAPYWNTPEWNPLGYLIKPGMTVVIKPNFILSRHDESKDVFSIITHPSVLRAIVDYCWIALKGEGRIIIADAPQYNCNFRELLEITKLEEVRDFINIFSDPKVDIYDFRDYWSKTHHFPSCTRKLPGDPQGKIIVNLGKESALYNYHNPSELYGAAYHRQETVDHHSEERQEYELSRTIFDADVVISVPKLKVHKKVGVTLNLKGLVGICTNKNFLPHYTLGSPSEGGDQFPESLFTQRERAVIKFERWMYDHFLAKRTIRHEFIHRLIYGFIYLRVFSHFGLRIPKEKRLLDAGNWYGNDTAWRMVVDLAKIIHFVDKEGKLHDEPQRKLFSVVDGIVGGENVGPLVPDPKPAGILIGGDNLLAVDLVATRLMGFDSSKLKQFTMLDPKFDFGPKNLEEIEIRSNERVFREGLTDKANMFLAFKPHPGWVSHVELM